MHQHQHFATTEQNAIIDRETCLSDDRAWSFKTMFIGALTGENEGTERDAPSLGFGICQLTSAQVIQGVRNFKNNGGPRGDTFHQ